MALERELARIRKRREDVKLRNDLLEVHIRSFVNAMDGKYPHHEKRKSGLQLREEEFLESMMEIFRRIGNGKRAEANEMAMELEKRVVKEMIKFQL